ncbi:MAG: AI-2E family transporter, partial [Gemmatimonadaceae bacterium]
MTDTTERLRRFRRLTLPAPVFSPTATTVEIEAQELSAAERQPISAATGSLVLLAVLATCVTLYVGRGLIMPIVVSVMLGFLLRPPVRWFRRRGLREPIGAMIVVVGGVLIVVLIARILAAPASTWLERAPEAIENFSLKLQRTGGPVAQLEATAAKVEQIATGGQAGARQAVTPVPARTPLLNRMFGDLTDFVGGIFSVIFLTYFLLASGDLFMRKMTDMMPRGRARMPREISAEIETSVSRYLRTITLINIGLGLATWGALAALQMPNAGLWGMLAGVLNIVPYLGAVATAGILTLAAVASFDSLGQALLMPGAFLALNLVEANVVTPVLLGREFPLNPVAVFVGLLFWGFVWGVPGAILAVPMMVTLKIVCDRFLALRAVGE